MQTGKRALMCVFKPNKLKSTQEMRKLFAGSYPRFLEMETVEFKIWWVDQEKQEWGGFYIFESEKALNEYIASDWWQKGASEKYGCVPTWTVVDPGPILSKKIITTFEKF